MNAPRRSLDGPRPAAEPRLRSAGEPWQQPAAEYIRSGDTPFFRLPRAGLETGDPYAGAGAVLLGVPFDGGATIHAAARLAPYHVRRVSAFVQGFHPTHRCEVLAATRAVDGGNVVVPPSDGAAMRELVRTEVARVLAAEAVPLVLGGDHSVALPALRAVAGRFGPVAVVHVDAHLDTSDGALWGDAYHHGTPLRHALDEGLVAPGLLWQVGVRAASADEEEATFSRRRGAQVIGMDELGDRGVSAVARDVVRRARGRKVYVTFDVDALDPAYAPGTGTPVPGGLSSREAIAFLRALAGVDLAGMDVVEVAPALDHADVTSHLAAQLLYEGLGLAAVRDR
jgi:agmatinase